MDDSLGPWFPDLPLAGHQLLRHTQLSPGTAPARKSLKIPHFLLSLFHPPPSQSSEPAPPPSPSLPTCWQPLSPPQLPQALHTLYLTASVGQVVSIPVLAVKMP